MDWLLRKTIRALVPHGNLTLTSAAGTVMSFGDGGGIPVAARFTSRRAQIAVILNPELKLGEAYMDGSFVIERGSIADFLRLVMSGAPYRVLWWMRAGDGVRYIWRRLRQLNLRRRARHNVAHHYDLDDRLYSLFLDSDRQYSCAYFETPDSSLDDAQRAKKRRIAAKLLMPPQARVLDIGCGWGGLALYLSEVCDARVTGITLSREQHAVAQQQAAERRLDGAVDFRLQDYRDVDERFDRIVSVGMFEHVGVGFYDKFFRKCTDLMTERGVMLLHAIGRSQGPTATNPWVEKYIFPGGYIPALSEVLRAVERSGLLVTDIEILRLHYADTLKEWRARFLAHRDEAERLYDRRFVRMWEFYIASAELSFRIDNLMVFQIQLTKHQGVVPITRGYIAREENRLRAIEQRQAVPQRFAGE
jgi:cyclopropane-fatty-acyl-phospholipid synthase